MENNLVKVQTEDGEELNLLILEEFEYKKKKYAVLTELDNCDCEDDCGCKEGKECTCGDDCGCKEGKECTCGDDCGCKEGKECTCGDDCGCKEGKECTCKDDCNCDDESLFILEITKDKDGNEIFKSIDDDKLFEELINETEKLFD